MTDRAFLNPLTHKQLADIDQSLKRIAAAIEMLADAGVVAGLSSTTDRPFCRDCLYRATGVGAMAASGTICLHAEAVSNREVDLVTGDYRQRRAAWQMRGVDGACRPSWGL